MVRKGEQIDAVIFDLGDTLMYFSGEVEPAFDLADEQLYSSLVANGVNLDRALFLNEYRRKMVEYYRNREIDLVESTNFKVLQDVLDGFSAGSQPETVLRRCLAEMYAVFQALWIPDPDAIETLQILKSRGYRLGLVSNAADDANVQVLIDKARIRPFFDKIITSAGLGLRKPAPMIFKPLLDLWQILPERIAMVGDTLGADILGAENVGMFSIWVTAYADKPGNRANAGKILPRAVVNGLKDLPGLLKGLGK